MTIIQISALETGQHPIQSQSGRDACWLEGWIEVLPQLEKDVWDTLGWCNLNIQDGKLVSITPTTRPDPPPEPPKEPTEAEKLRADVDYLSVMTGVELV